MNDSALIGEARRAVSAYIGLLDASPSDPDHELAMLLDILQALELVGRKCKGREGLPDEDAPSQSLSWHLDFAKKRFPWMGFYNLPSSVTEVSGPPENLIGDGHDDVGDIHHDLLKVQWHMEHSSPEAAIAVIAFGWQYHWGAHLTNLRWYLFHLENESAEL